MASFGIWLELIVFLMLKKKWKRELYIEMLGKFKPYLVPFGCIDLIF